MDALDFIEAQAQQLAAFRLETMELLNKRAHTLVTLLLGGGGALAAYGANLLERHAALALVAAVLAASCWLFGVAGVATLKCLRTLEVVPPGQDPAPLLALECTTQDLRRGVLESLQRRMAGWVARNVHQARWLDRAYLAAALTPVAAIVAALASLWLYPGVLG